MEAIYYKYGDTSQKIQVRIESQDPDTLAWSAFDITSYSGTSKLQIQSQNGGSVIEKSATRETPYTDGIVSWTPAASDWGSDSGNLAAGKYNVEVQLFDGSGKRLTAPTRGKIVLVVEEDLAA